jgi:Tfp pilus assembly protein FimT
VTLACTDAITPCYTTVQAAVDAVDDPETSSRFRRDGTPISLGSGSGRYHGAEVITQVLYLTKTVALRGGYDATFITWAPSVYTTTGCGGQGAGALCER